MLDSIDKLNIVIITDSGYIPSLYVRLLDPIRIITRNYNVISSYEDGVEAIADTADILVVQRWLGSDIRKIVDDAHKKGIPIIYETDDNLLDLSENSTTILDDCIKDNIRHTITIADQVICSTEFLADALRVYNTNVFVISNYGIPKKEVDQLSTPHLGLVNCDYFKLDAGKSGFFDAIEAAIDRMNYSVTFFGSVDTFMKKLQLQYPEKVNIVDNFIDNRSLFLDRMIEHNINVGIVPLSENRQHSYKSDIKFMDFASISAPAIYNNRTVYSSVRDGIDGIMCEDSFQGWYAALAYLENKDNRQRIGKAAFNKMLQGRTLSTYADRLKTIILDTYKNKHKKLIGATEGAQSPQGVFWNNRHLYLLENNTRRHIINLGLLPDILDSGFGMLEFNKEYNSIKEGEPLTALCQIGELGVSSAVQRHSTTAIRAKAAHGRPLRISWIVPGLIIGGGGHRNIIRCAYQLELLGHKVAIYFTDTGDSGQRCAELVREHFYPLEGDIGLFRPSAIEGSDILFVTHWSTVKYGEKCKDNVGEIVYFVQDFEPNFYAMGSEYILSEDTYRKGFYAITSGVWCENFLRKNFNSEADHFQFPIDKTIYYSTDDKRRERVIFFAKPEMPRRCYEIGVQALRHFHTLRPDVEIAFYGSNEAAKIALDFPVTQLGILPGPKDLADLYRTSKVGMVFSTTNPSLVPYEMMACGLPVIDLDRAGNDLNYGGRKDIACLVRPDPVVMGSALADLLLKPDELKSRSNNGIAFAESFPTESDVGQRIEKFLLARVARWAEEERV